jgi:capsular polysaccharide biosynthesis protein
MDYIDLYKGLNPHLHIAADARSTHADIETVVRKPANILRHSSEMIETLKRSFGFSDALFSEHTVSFPKHTVQTKQHVIGHFLAADVRSRWGNTYYHFLTEVIPSVLFINRPNAVLACLHAPFVEPMLRWFGVQNHIVFGPPANARMVLTQPYIECGNPSPAKISLLRNEIEKRVAMNPEIGIFIYRQEHTRKILNPDYVLDMLKRVYPALEWHVFDRLDVGSTARLFSRAKIIVGPHGAGFTNMLFAPRNIHIVELMPLESPNICYWHLSELLGNKHFIIPCSTVNTQFTIDDIETLLPPIECKEP